MGRKVLRSWICLALAVSAMWAAVGCLGLQNSSAPAQSGFWTIFEPAKLQAHYAASLEPMDSASSVMESGSTKSLWFKGVRQNEWHMAEILASLERDLVEMVKTNGGELCGEVHEIKSRRFLKKFEFAYRQGKITGNVWGEVKPGHKELSWDLECVVSENTAH